MLTKEESTFLSDYLDSVETVINLIPRLEANPSYKRIFSDTHFRVEDLFRAREFAKRVIATDSSIRANELTKRESK